MPGGSTVIVIDADRLVPIDDLREAVAAQVDHVKSSDLMDETKPVQFPGEYEVTNRRQRLEEGVEIEQDTWDIVAQTVRDLGLEGELLGGIA